MESINEIGGGKDYEAGFSTRMKGSGLWADMIRQRFDKACARLVFNRQRVMLDTTHFRRPSPDGQQTLF